MTIQMFRRGRAARTAVAALLVALPAPALADLTSEALWSQWQDYMSSFGYNVSAKTAPGAGGLTISDMKMAMPLNSPEGNMGTVVMTLGEIRFEDRPDGTVRITMPDHVPLTIDMLPKDEAPVKVVLDYSAPGFTAVASGTTESTHYDFASDRMTVALKEVEAKDVAKDLGTVRMTAAGLAGTSDIGVGAAAFDMRQALKIDSVDYVVDIVNPDPKGTGTFKLSGRMTGLSSDGGGTIPRGIDMADFGAALKAGYAVDATFGYTTGESQMAFRDETQAFDFSSSSSGGRFAVSMSTAGFLYDIASRALKIHASGPEMPFPVNIGVEEAGMKIALPVIASDEQQDFAAGITLAGITLPEEVWSMADPVGGLPHEPLTARIALSGKGRLLVDLLDETQMMSLGDTGAVPGMIDSLRIDTFQLKAVGAEITATADLTVDNQSKSPLGPYPNVFGVADLRMTNILGLMQKLTQMGLIPAPQAMMVAGMAQQLGEPVNGPDDLKAHIDLSEQGDLSINGNPFPLR